jgi:hypothetical protein
MFPSSGTVQDVVRHWGNRSFSAAPGGSKWRNKRIPRNLISMSTPMRLLSYRCEDRKEVGKVRSGIGATGYVIVVLTHSFRRLSSSSPNNKSR